MIFKLQRVVVLLWAAKPKLTLEAKHRWRLKRFPWLLNKKMSIILNSKLNKKANSVCENQVNLFYNWLVKSCSFISLLISFYDMVPAALKCSFENKFISLNEFNTVTLSQTFTWPKVWKKLTKGTFPSTLKIFFRWINDDPT